MTVGLLDRYLWRQLGQLFVLGVAIFTMLLTVNHLFFLTRAVLAGKALSVALELLVYRLPALLAFSFPMAMLLAALLTIGRLSDSKEITAMRTSGISLTRIGLSITVAGVLVSAMTLAVNEGVVPPAEDRYQRATWGAPSLSEQRDVLFREVAEGIESVYFVRRIQKDQARMEGVVVDQFENRALNRVIEAAEGRYIDGAWELHDGRTYVFTGETSVVTRFARMRIGLERTPQEIALPRKDPSELSIRELRQYADVLQRSGENAARYIVQIHFRFAVPMSAALFALLAVPVGLRPQRSGTSIGLGLTILVLIAYYLISATTLPLGENGRLHPILAAWSADIVLAVAGIVLLRRVDR